MRANDDRLIIITGGAGFIGSAAIRYLNNRGVKNLVIIDDLGSDEKWKNLVGKSFKEIVPIVCCFDWLKGREKEISAFLHLGACSSTIEKNADFLLENNTKFSIKLAEYALEHNHRFVYASSAATYGDGAKGFSDNHEFLDGLEPLNMYGYSKHLFDLWAKSTGALSKIVGLKFFNVFGPNESHKGRMASAIHHIFPVARSEGVIHLFKSNDPEHYVDGGQCRDFIYVKDAVRMAVAFLDNEAVGIFNIGTSKAGTWNEVAASVFKALEKPKNIQYIPMPEDLMGKYQNYTRADMSKTAGVLGQEAFCDTLENSIIDYVRNYLIPEKRW